MVRELNMATITYTHVCNSQIINKNALLEKKGGSTGIPVIEGSVFERKGRGWAPGRLRMLQ